MISKDEKITIGWCDNGSTDGKFVEGLMSVLFNKESKFIPDGSVRVEGTQIARQRQNLLDFWYDNLKTDWLFWVDSDIVLTPDIWEKICNTANKKTHSIVSGIYFIAKDKDGSIPIPLPCIFNDIDEFSMQYHHPLPDNEIIKIDSAGMGLVLMHRSVVTKLRKEYGKEIAFFAENDLKGDKFTGEDIAFFRKCKKINIPVHAHTGAIAQHVKRMAWDIEYYSLYWYMKNFQKQQNNK
jgi:hypothetical protein